MRLKDLVVGRDYVLGENRSRYYTSTSSTVTVLSTSLHRWLFRAVPESQEGFVELTVGGTTYRVPEELTILRSGGTKGALITWIGYRGRGDRRDDVRYFHVISASQILMSHHDYELVMAKQIAEEERKVAESRKQAEAEKRVRGREVSAFNAVLGRRVAGRPEDLSPQSLEIYIQTGNYGVKKAMAAALWGAGPKKQPASRKKQP
jgi:hypothetical protein